ncbi:MAG: efflux RND transporter periplasmic adaptor subunit [Planctomycetaceae bacterium]
MKRTLALCYAVLMAAAGATKPASAQSFADEPGDQSQHVIEGFTEPYRDIEIGSPDTASVAEIWVDEGAEARVGQVLARLHDSVVRANVNIAREAAASTGEYEAAKLSLNTNQRKYDQVLALHGRDHATEQELWNARAARDESLAKVKAYEELASRRRLELVQAEAHLERFTIRAPIDGVVVKKFKDVGEVVSPADPQLLRVVQLDPLRISATATVAQIASLRVGQTLPATIGETSVAATIEFISPVADPSSSTVQVQLRVPNPDYKISGGISCEIRLDAEPLPSRPNRASIPRQTLKVFPFDGKHR